MQQLEGVLREIYVQPGESHLVTEPVILRTVLGSCVGIAFLIPRLGVGALCHPMLPTCPPKVANGPDLAEGRRYVDFAIRDLADQFDALGAHRAEVRVKLFGGADVLAAISASTRPTVGRLNSEVALRTLREFGFEVVASSLGGNRGVNLKFNTESGEVLLRRLN
jgi:chemotaxis protein CheD